MSPASKWKIALAQINSTVGDLPGNASRILNAYRRALDAGAELVLFPELVLAGYPPRDLLLKKRFLRDCRQALQDLAGGIGEVPAVIGFAEANPGAGGREAFNAAAWCERGEIRHIARKCLLPTYDVFDEDRYFESGREPLLVEHRGARVGLTICEDLWVHPGSGLRFRYSFDPVEYLVGQSVDLILNLSASPWYRGKEAEREEVVASAARRCAAPVFYCNAIGGNDELIFDGHSLVADANGTLCQMVPGFEESVTACRAEEDSTPGAAGTGPGEEIESIRRALVLGLRDYTHKSGFRKAVIGLSGGIDSAVTAALAAEALGAPNVHGIALPSRISSDHSRDDAASLARNLGIGFHEIPVARLVDAADEALGPLFAGMEPDVTEENIQARSRGLLLMAVSNKTGALLLSTGNKSELAVGYTTLYGDMAGGLAVISDLPKTGVYELARHINRDREVIPWNSISKPPSAELRPGQTDQDSLPPYELLDEILRLYIEEHLSGAEIIEAGYEAEVVREIIRKVDLNEYKRKQAPPGLKITPLAFGVGRRIPIVQKYVS